MHGLHDLRANHIRNSRSIPLRDCQIIGRLGTGEVATAGERWGRLAGDPAGTTSLSVHCAGTTAHGPNQWIPLRISRTSNPQLGVLFQPLLYERLLRNDRVNGSLRHLTDVLHCDCAGCSVNAVLIVRSIYRVYLSPLAKFPGPKLAALTLWYEFYYDVWLGGQNIWKIRELHEEYGPIIRISPYEIHIISSSYYEELFAGSSQKRNKYEWFTKQFATPLAAFGTVDHNLHRLRRSAMSPFFSKASVRRLQPVIQEKINKLISRIDRFRQSSEALNIHLAYIANSSDVIAEYSFGRNYGRLDQEDFDPEYAQAMHDATGASHFNKQIFWPFATLLVLPPWIGTKIAPGLSGYVSFINDCAIQVKAIKGGTSEKSQLTIFHHLIESKDIPDSEKIDDRLVQEAQVVVSAGTETTAWSMSVLTFHLLSDPEILAKLREELKRAIPDPKALPNMATLEQLPYLTACIQEALRFSYGLASRLARISPEKPMVFNDGKKDWVIPAGTPTSMTAYFVHHDEAIFPNSHEYIPERWIENPRLDKYMCSFTKGTRQCVGINFAYAVMYMTTAAVFRRYDGPESEDSERKLELFETTSDDVVMVADKFVPWVKAGSKGVRVRVKN